MQAVIAVLHSLVKTDWEFVAIEPNEANQKVDIQWWDGNDDVTVFQVKSSINNFGKTDILGMLKELTDDLTDAVAYKLVLIGTYSEDTIRFFNRLKEQDVADIDVKYHSILPFRDKITTDFKALDLQALDGLVESKVHEFLSLRDFVVGHSMVQLIALTLHAQFTRFATDGRKVSRVELEKQILEWLKFNFPKVPKKDNAPLALAIYDNGKTDESNVYRPNRTLISLDQLPYVLNAKKELSDNFHKIDKIKLPPKKAAPEFSNPNRISTFAIYQPFDFSFAGYDDDEISAVSILVEKLLNKQLPHDFFHVGEVKRSTESFAISFGRNNYIGTDSEVEKRKLLGGFIYDLKSLNDLLESWRELQTYKIVPLIIRNDGDLLNSNLELQLTIPDNVEVLTINNFPYPGYSDALDYLSKDNGLLEILFQHTKDSKVKEYDHRRFRPIDHMLYDPIFGKPKQAYLDHFKRVLERVLDYEIFTDVVDFNTYACAFKNLKPQDQMALPSHLFIKYSEPFTIKYTLRSDQSAGCTGELKIV